VLAIETLAGFAAGLSLDAVPGGVIACAKRQVLDAITCAVTASRVPGGAIPAAVGGRSTGPARILASGASVDPVVAAFTNAQMSVASDLGSNLLFTQGLGGLALFPALALAERDRCSGRALLEAVIAGYEVAARVALSFPPGYVVAPDGKSIVGYDRPRSRWIIFGGAAAVAKILGLSAARTVHALALAGASAPLRPSGRLFSGDVVPMAKYGLHGHMATAVLLNGELAGLGFTGDERMIDDPDGFHRALGSELADPGALTRDLGTRWWIEEARPKRYPTGTHNQQASHAFAGIMRDNDLRPDDIRSITVGRAIGTDGLFANQWPRNYVAAQFSLPFALAAIACGVAPRDWDEAFEDPGVRAFAQRVTLRSDPRAIADFAALPADESRSPWSARTLVEVVAASGTLARWSEYPSFTDAEAAGKLRGYCAGVLDEGTMDAVIDGALHLETLADARELTAPFAQRAAA
jgi:2-methylcitrate dehydratase PrpD